MMGLGPPNIKIGPCEEKIVFVPSDVILSNRDLMFLAGSITGRSLKRAVTKIEAISVFNKALDKRLGVCIANDCRLTILKQSSPITAHKLLGTIIEKANAGEEALIKRLLTEDNTTTQEGNIQPQGEYEMPNGTDTVDSPVITPSGVPAGATVTPEGKKAKMAREPGEKAPKEPKAAKAPSATKRGPKLTGKKLSAIKDDDGRRETSKGKISYNIIKNNPGITTEEFVAQGGRMKDALWDIKFGVIKAD